MMRKRAAAMLAAAAATVGIAGLSAPAANASVYGDTEITGVTVNGGKSVVIGTTYAKTFKVTVRGRDDSGLASVDTDLTGPAGYFFKDGTRCQSATSCTASYTIDPRVDLYNENAGTWYVGAWLDANDGDFAYDERIGHFSLKRAANLTVNASPEPVKKGAPITVSGTLKRANWDTHHYAGYTKQTVALQFRKSGTTTYKTVKTVISGTGGGLWTRVTASADGTWRWYFPGTATTGAVTVAGDYVDVR
ncbi:hypothetical protein ABZV93_26170 [Actinopolymorpha sp. NPDC004070]|uniref:hypothetical protein n=1 Tax=Actinopolymorpha sp. NPDC004070 TaxID=3154548 RepID=UPI0033A4C7B0